MDIREALETARDYESRIRDLYLEAVQSTEDPTGRKVFQELADDEQSHLDYLERRLEELQETGAVTNQPLHSSLPDRETVRKEAAKLRAGLKKDDRGLKAEMLGKALALEKETSDFYRRLVERIDQEHAGMFSQFLEIEANHVEIVQFELDHITHNGYWFGFEEFNLEVE